jgi:hypothetical protein
MNLKLKMRDMPGDIPKSDKIRLMEGRPSPGDEWRAKGFRKLVRMKERAVLKRRALREIVEGT